MTGPTLLSTVGVQKAHLSFVSRRDRSGIHRDSGPANDARFHMEGRATPGPFLATGRRPVHRYWRTTLTLATTNPSIWCEASIDAPGFRVSGFTLPGTPGLAIGRTPTFAWGLTAAMISQTFLYREQVDADRNLVATGADWSAMAIRTEEIGRKGQSIGKVADQIDATRPAAVRHPAGMVIERR